MEARIFYKEKTYTFEHNRKQLRFSCLSGVGDVQLSLYLDGTSNVKTSDKSIDLKFSYHEAEVLGQILLAFSKLRNGLIQANIPPDNNND